MSPYLRASFLAFCVTSLATAASVAAGQTSKSEFETMQKAHKGAEASGAKTPSAAPAMGRANCTIRASREIALSPVVEGVVSEVHVSSGAAVTEGQLLMQIDTRRERAELAVLEAEAALDGAVRAAQAVRDALGAKVARLETAYGQKAVSFAEVETARLERDRAEAELTRLQTNQQMAKERIEPMRQRIALADIRSPYDGIVGEDMLHAGEATSGVALMTIYVLSPLRVEVIVPSAMVGQLQKTQRLTFEVDGVVQPAEAVVFDYIAPIADYASNTVSAYFNLASETVIPGSKCIAMF